RFLSVPLQECVTLIRDTIQPEQCPNERYIGLEHIAAETLQLLDYGWAVDVKSPKLRFQQGDILYGRLRPYFRKVIRAPFDGVCSTELWVLRPKPGFDPDFLFYLIAHPNLTQIAHSSSQGTAMPRADWAYVSCQTVSIPPKAVQTVLA